MVLLISNWIRHSLTMFIRICNRNRGEIKSQSTLQNSNFHNLLSNFHNIFLYVRNYNLAIVLTLVYFSDSFSFGVPNENRVATITILNDIANYISILQRRLLISFEHYTKV